MSLKTFLLRCVRGGPGVGQGGNIFLIVSSWLRGLYKCCSFKYYKHALVRVGVGLSSGSSQDGSHFRGNRLLHRTWILPYAGQTRFFPTSDSTIFAYSLPVPFPANNLSSAALVLSGYDLQPSRALNFRANLSVNYISSTFQVLVETANQTKFYSLNFFLISISQEASSWLSIQTYCTRSSMKVSRLR